jgi:hypothetical protein
MFLAPTRTVQEYEVAEVEARFLEAQAGGEPAQGRSQQEKAAEAGMASTNCVGMPVELGETSGANMRVLAGRMRAVELFTGAGGLALGIENAGFHHDTVIERDKDCCSTIRQNQGRGFKPLQGWQLFPGDVRHFEFRDIRGRIDLLAGGPPCQPFSIGGKHKGPLDKRDMFPQMVRAVRDPTPSLVISQV